MDNKPKGMIRLVQAQVPTEAADAYGQMVPAWTTTFSTSAEILPLMGRELVKAQQLRADVTHQLTIRYAASQPVTPQMRFLYGFLALEGTLANGSAAVTGLDSTARLVAGMAVQGDGIPDATFVRSIDSPTAITLSQDATADGAATLTFLRTFNASVVINEEERDLRYIVLCKETVTPQ